MSRFTDGLADAARPCRRSDLLALGVTRGRLAGPHWRSTSHGWYAPTTAGRGPTGVLIPAQVVLDAVPLVPASGALGGWAAAYVHGVDWLDGQHHRASGEAVSVVLGSEQHHLSAASRIYRGFIEPWERILVHGIAVTTVARTAFDCARWAPNLAEAVVVVDSFRRFTALTQTELTEWLRHVRGWRGVVRARLASALSSDRALSPWESRLRMVCVLDCHLATPLVNASVRDLDANALLGVADLFCPDAGLVLEYDGAHHREPGQHHADNLREEGLEGLNLSVVRVDSRDFGHPRHLAGRIVAAHARGLTRDRTKDRWSVSLDALPG